MSERTSRVGEAIKEVLAMILEKDTADPRLEMVTLTGVDVSPDLRHAHVYYSVLGGKRKQLQCEQALENAKGYLRTSVAKSLSIKCTPELSFFADRSIETGGRIDTLINRYRAEGQ